MGDSDRVELGLSLVGVLVRLLPRRDWERLRVLEGFLADTGLDLAAAWSSRDLDRRDVGLDVSLLVRPRRRTLSDRRWEGVPGSSGDFRPSPEECDRAESGLVASALPPPETLVERRDRDRLRLLEDRLSLCLSSDCCRLVLACCCWGVLRPRLTLLLLSSVGDKRRDLASSGFGAE